MYSILETAKRQHAAGLVTDDEYNQHRRRAGLFPYQLDTEDWAIVFGVCDWHTSNGDHTTATPDPVPPTANVDKTPFTRKDIEELLHICEDTSQGYGQWAGTVVAKLKDGRYASAYGWCDTTGWG